MPETIPPSRTLRVIPDLLHHAAESWGLRVAMRRRREALRWGVTTWAEVRQQVHDLAAGLLAAGVVRGDRVAILAATRQEWILADLAILCTGAISVPIYHSYTPAQVAYVLNNSGARVCFVDTLPRLRSLSSAWDKLRTLEKAILMDVADLAAEEKVIGQEQVIRQGRRLLREQPHALAERIAALTPQDRATYVYTSGTTGLPKGVVLTHGMLVHTVEAMAGLLPVGEEDTTVAFLPLSHIYGRIGALLSLEKGFSTAYAQRMDDLSEVFREIRPTFLFAVPRVYERIYAQALSGFEGLSPLRRRLVEAGFQARRVLVNREGASVDWKVRGAAEVAERALFAPIRSQMGGRVRFAVCGGAPLPQAVAEFFHTVGVPLLEGYGLTETCGAGSLATEGDYLGGTVGRPLPGMQIQIAGDGEILMKGEAVFHEYYRLPAETREAFDGEGWFRTGDLGEILPSGHLRITGRKKDIIVTSGGKNVAPQRVEALLRASPLIAEALAYGEGRPHLVALLIPHEDRLREAITREGRALSGALHQDPVARLLLQREVDRANGQLARYESVRNFAVLQEEPTVEDGGLTPTLKPRRHQIFQRHREVIEELYRGVKV